MIVSYYLRGTICNMFMSDAVSTVKQKQASTKHASFSAHSENKIFTAIKITPITPIQIHLFYLDFFPRASIGLIQND